MKYDYQYKIDFKLNKPFDIGYVKNICNQYPNSKILVEVQNTKGITSSMIRQLGSNVTIRIAGGYDDERCRNGFGKENGQSYYYDAVIYSKNETIKILEEIEKIESGLNRNWSDIQKILYIYERLKTGIMYDPKYEYKLSSEIRSLRGLITKQTVCAGYSMILKEFMDRNGIDCEYVEGYTKIDENGIKTDGHAWNIVNIGDKKYPIDLTWDNETFRSGKSNGFDWLGRDISIFSRNHHPAPGEKTQDYEHTLSQFDVSLLKKIYRENGIGRTRNYKTTSYSYTRQDGSKFIISQIGDSIIDNELYFRYYYSELSNDGKKQLPLILYSEVNVTNFIDSKNFGRYIPPKYGETIGDVLFSRENIADSIAKNTYYIGKINKSTDSNKVELVSSYREISKPEDKKNKFIYPTKRFIRSDGSVFIAQQMLKEPRKIKNVDVMQYDIFEIVNEDGKEVLKRNTVFTERNFFNDIRQSMVDDYLSRERLDRKANESGGYIGYYDSNGIRIFNPDLVEYFETSKKIDIDSLNDQKSQEQSLFIKIPAFNELKDLISKYEIFFDSKDPFDQDVSKIKIRDIETGQIQTDKSIVYKAMFANIWLSSAGVKYEYGEKIPGEIYAFNNQTEKLYNIICGKLLTSCKSHGVIDTVALFKNIENNSDYKYSQEIVVNLFRTPYQTEMINKLFLQSLGISQSSCKPETLYTMSYAGELAFDYDNSSMRGK